MNNNFNKWLDTFLTEKDVNLDGTFEFNNENGFNLMTYAVVVEYVKNTTKENQVKVKNTLVKIDFLNGDVLDFLKFLGKGIA